MPRWYQTAQNDVMGTSVTRFEVGAPCIIFDRALHIFPLIGVTWILKEYRIENRRFGYNAQFIAF